MSRPVILRVGRKYKVPCTEDHIIRGKCHNRRQCMDALAIYDFFSLDEKSYLSVEDLVAFSQTKLRHTFKCPRPERERMALFDEHPELAEPHTIHLTLIEIKPCDPPSTRQRMDRINELRRNKSNQTKEEKQSPPALPKNRGSYHPRFVTRHSAIYSDEE